MAAAFKQGSRNTNNNYSPISILRLITRKIEKLISRQLSNYFGNSILKFQCGFRKVFF